MTMSIFNPLAVHVKTNDVLLGRRRRGPQPDRLCVRLRTASVLELQVLQPKKQDAHAAYVMQFVKSLTLFNEIISRIDNRKTILS